MHLALIVIPDPSAPSGEHRLDAQKVFHLSGLEDPALWVDERDALAAEREPARKIGGIEDAYSQGMTRFMWLKAACRTWAIVADGVSVIRGYPRSIFQ
jgi:hypothetical protein